MSIVKATEIKKKKIEYSKILTACSEEKYSQGEGLSEVKMLNNEMKAIIFTDKHIANTNISTDDMLKHLERKINEAHMDAADLFEPFVRECKKMDEYIAKNSAGIIGEKKTRRALELIENDVEILQNIQLNDETKRSEIDFIVISRKAIFLIEAKNPSTDVVINKHGDYYKSTNSFGLGSVGEKMNIKETLVRNVVLGGTDGIIRKKHIKIIPLLTFANNSIKVTNHYDYLKSCSLAQLPHIIREYQGEDIYSEEDIELIKESILSAHNPQEYAPDFNVSELKNLFCEIMAELDVRLNSTSDMAKQNIPEEENESSDDKSDNLLKVFWSKTRKGAKKALPVLLTAAITVAGTELYEHKYGRS